MTGREQEEKRMNCYEAPSNVVGLLRLMLECLDVSKPIESLEIAGRLFFAINNSRIIKRSPFRTTIMLIGASGAGKSSTINHLLNSDVVPVSSSKSETRSVTEYTSASTSSDRLIEDGKKVNFSVSNLKFSLIDTPGLNDTSGEVQDACNMWAIKKFLKDNCDNIERGDAGMLVYPNIVLLCFNATDNRFEGENSCFVKNLKLLQTMDVIDSKTPNVVIAMTHVYSIPPKDWEARVGKKVEKVKSVFKSAMGFEAPVVYLENDFEGQCLSTDDDKTGTVLRNGEVQPTNLYKAMMDVLKRNNDQFAYLTIRQFFRQGVLGQTFKEDRSEPCKIATSEKDLDDDEKKCRDALANRNSEAAQRLKEENVKELQQQNDNFRIAADEIQKALQDPSTPQNVEMNPPQVTVVVNANNNSGTNPIINVDVNGRTSFVESETPLPDKPKEGWFSKKMALGVLAFAVVGVAAVATAPAVATAAGPLATAASAYLASGTGTVAAWGTAATAAEVGGVAGIAGVTPIVLAGLGKAIDYFT